MFTRLTVWQKSMELAEEIYKLTSTFPSSEAYGLVTQINRCAVSIPSNIAEGKGRQTDREFKQFLYIARGSVFELRTQLELARRLKFIDSDIALKDKILEVQKMLNILINKL
jgi:four helix bundle protein